MKLMKNGRLAQIKIRVLAFLTVLSLVAVPLIQPMKAWADSGDSLASRGCITGEPNLVQNPGFETLNQSAFYAIQNIDAQNVNGWGTGSAGYNYDQYRPITFGSGVAGIGLGSFFSTSGSYINVYEGGRAATLPGFHPPSSPQYHSIITGTLSQTSANAVTAGSKYQLSARVYKDDQVGSPAAAIEMRLYSSTDQTVSAPVRASVSDASSWALITGTVTATKSYDKILMRYWKDGDWVLVDDVVVCKTAVQTPSHITWQNIVAVASASLALLVLLGGVVTTRRTRGSSSLKHKASSGVAVGDINGDGKLDMKVNENQSSRPLTRNFMTNKIVLGIAGLVLVVAAIYIATAGGGIWKNTNNASDSKLVTGCVKGDHIKEGVLTCAVVKPSNDTKAQPTSVTPAKTCQDTETVKESYQLFRSDTYKYCIQYPKNWPVNPINAAEVTFGKVPAAEPGPGWLKTSHFSGKTIATRSEEIKSNFKEPAGPCTESDITLASGESGKKLDCTGAANGEDHVYVLLGHGTDLYELSYIEAMGEQKAVYDSQYKIMVDSFLTDTVANK